MNTNLRRHPLAWEMTRGPAYNGSGGSLSIEVGRVLHSFRTAPSSPGITAESQKLQRLQPKCWEGGVPSMATRRDTVHGGGLNPRQSFPTWTAQTFVRPSTTSHS